MFKIVELTQKVLRRNPVTSSTPKTPTYIQKAPRISKIYTDSQISFRNSRSFNEDQRDRPIIRNASLATGSIFIILSILSQILNPSKNIDHSKIQTHYSQLSLEELCDEINLDGNNYNKGTSTIGLIYSEYTGYPSNGRTYTFEQSRCIDALSSAIPDLLEKSNALNNGYINLQKNSTIRVTGLTTPLIIKPTAKVHNSPESQSVVT
ncbi:MAG: hypothetical protein QNJ31_01540 [Candidatus Caenarcaniphilales bacterium]|nr:hypothetical protein [Candidatus Caenarcaniphilales bacterium]